MSQMYSRSELRIKQPAANSKKGVVGSTGMKIPITANPRARMPALIRSQLRSAPLEIFVRNFQSPMFYTSLARLRNLLVLALPASRAKPVKSDLMSQHLVANCLFRRQGDLRKIMADINQGMAANAEQMVMRVEIGIVAYATFAEAMRFDQSAQRCQLV